MNNRNCDDDRIEKLADRLRRNVPILGDWLHRQTLRSLERCGSESAISTLAHAVQYRQDPVKRLAIEALKRIAASPVCAATQSAINACLAFSSYPETERRNQSIDPLIEGLRSTPDWPTVYAQNALCDLFIQSDDASLRSFLIKNGITSYLPVTRLRVLFLTGQFDVAFGSTFEPRLGLIASGIGLRSFNEVDQRVAKVAIDHGSQQWAEMIVEAPEKLAPYHWDAAIQIFRKANAYDQLWRILRVMSPILAAGTLEFLNDNRWRPLGEERAKFEQLLPLAERWGNRYSPIIAPAVAFQGEWVKPSENMSVHIAPDFILTTDSRPRLSGDVLEFETIRYDGVTISCEYAATYSSKPYAVSDDMKWLLHGDQAGVLTVRELPSLAIRVQKRVMKIAIKNLAISSDPALVAVRGPRSAQLLVLNVPDLSHHRTLKSPMMTQDRATVEHLAFSCDRSTVACWTADSHLDNYSLTGFTAGFRCQLWNLGDGRPLSTNATHLKDLGMGSDWSAGWQWPTLVETKDGVKEQLRATHDSMTTECVSADQLWRAKIVADSVLIRRERGLAMAGGMSVEDSFSQLEIAGHSDSSSVQKIAWTNDNRLLVLASKSLFVARIGIQHAGIETLKRTVSNPQRTVHLSLISKECFSYELAGLQLICVLWDAKDAVSAEQLIATNSACIEAPPKIFHDVYESKTDDPQKSDMRLVSALIETLTDRFLTGEVLRGTLDALKHHVNDYPLEVVAGSLKCLENANLRHDDAEAVRQWLVKLGPIAVPAMLAAMGPLYSPADSVLRQMSAADATNAINSMHLTGIVKTLWAFAQSEAFDDEFKASSWWRLNVAQSYMNQLNEVHMQAFWQQMCDSSLFEKWSGTDDRDTDVRVFRFVAEWSNRYPNLWNPFFANVSVQQRALLIGVFPRLGEMQHMEHRNSDFSLVLYYNLAPPWIVESEPSLVPELFRQLFAIHDLPGLLDVEYGHVALCRCLSEMQEKWIHGLGELSTDQLLTFLRRIPSRSEAEQLFCSGGNRTWWIDADDVFIALLSAVEGHKGASARKVRTVYDKVLQEWSDAAGPDN